MSDYWPDDDEGLPLFTHAASGSVIAQHEVPDTAELEQKLIARLSPRGSTHSISALRATFYDRVETIVHRLRQQKHAIDTVDGHYIYRHGPPDGWVKAHKSIADKYRATRHWSIVSAQRIEMDGRCTLCRRVRPDVQLQAHHWRYNLFNEDIVRDLQTFCASCHRDLHIVIKNSSVSFPKVLPQEVIDRIEQEASALPQNAWRPL